MGRFFTDTAQRYWIWRSQDGLCAICGEELGEDFELDHRTPYSKGGKTHLANGQATCARCNREKGATWHGNSETSERRRATGDPGRNPVDQRALPSRRDQHID